MAFSYFEVMFGQEYLYFGSSNKVVFFVHICYQTGRAKANMSFLWGRWSQPNTSLQPAAYAMTDITYSEERTICPLQHAEAHRPSCVTMSDRIDSVCLHTILESMDNFWSLGSQPWMAVVYLGIVFSFSQMIVRMWF